MEKVQKIKENTVIFTIGAGGYGLIEILWRGYTHWSMLCAGGIVFLGMSRIASALKKASAIIKGIVGGAFVTAVEYAFGIVFNVILKKNVWDYSRMPFNINGQICALYSVLWVLLSIICVPFSGFIKKKLESSKN